MRLTYQDILELSASGAYGGDRNLSADTCALLLCALATYTEANWQWSDAQDYWDEIQSMVSSATNEIMYAVPGNGNGDNAVSVAIIADEKASGVEGGTFLTGDWRLRDVNTEISDPDNIVTVADNQFTVLPGTYYIWASAPAYRVSYHKARLYNVTLSEVLEISTSEISSSVAATTTRAIVAVVATFSTETVLELQHSCLTTYYNTGFGKAGSLDVERYSLVIIEKVG